MTQKKYSIDQVAEFVNSEGLGYAVQDYLSSEEIEDPKLAKEWQKAKKSLDNIQEMLSKYLDW